MNPLNHNSPAIQMLQMLNNAGGPQQFAQRVMQQNPQMQQIMDKLYNGPNGQNPKEIAMQLARERGIDPSQIMHMANKMGLN